MVNNRFEVGARVERKRDGAAGTIVKRYLAVSSFSRPGIYGSELVAIRLDDLELNAAAGGDQHGPVSWARSNFRIVKGGA